MLELVVVAFVGMLLLTSFTGFYVSQQRAVRRNEIEIETSQALRTSLEQMSRDLRLVGRDLSRAGFERFLTANAANVDFNIDAGDDGTPERKQYRLNGSTIEMCAGNDTGCNVLADFATGLTFAYFDCSGTALTALPLSAANRALIGRVDMTVTFARGMVGGTNVTRTERDSLTLRNLCN